MKRKTKPIIIIIILIIIAGLTYLYFQGKLPYQNPTPSELDKVTYIRAKDGDTIVVNKNGQEKTVRLIGIDTPESVHPDESKNTKEGEEASNHTKDILQGTTTLYLEYDIEKEDKYGRTLAYVWLNEDTSNMENMLNYRLVKEGYATPMQVKSSPNSKYRFF